MKRKTPVATRARRIFSRCGPLMFICQKAPIGQFIAHEARTLGVSSLTQALKWTVTVVSGLGAFDCVSGATQVKQIAPAAGSSSVPATNGNALNFVVQVTGAPSTAKSWRLSGTLPTGLTHSNATNSNTDSVVGVPRQNGSFPVTITAYEKSGFSGGSKSASFTISVAGGVSPPTISAQPASTTIASGTTFTLSVTAPGATAYQWYSGTSGDTTHPVGGAASAAFTTPALTATTSYWVRASNAGGAVISSTAVVSVNVTDPPVITTGPQSSTVEAGTAATLSVTATGSALQFQWYAGAAGDLTQPVDGAVDATFTTPVLTAAGSYWVRVSNAGGSIDSSPAVISIRDNFSSWSATRFSGSQVEDPAVSGPAMDPDGDGLGNEQEFAFGTTPLEPDVFAPLSLSEEGGQLILKFTALAASGPGYSGLTRHYALESSTTLGGEMAWTALPGNSDIAGQNQEVTFTVSAATPSDFYHLKIWLLPE